MTAKHHPQVILTICLSSNHEMPRKELATKFTPLERQEERQEPVHPRQTLNTCQPTLCGSSCPSLHCPVEKCVRLNHRIAQSVTAALVACTVTILARQFEYGWSSVWVREGSGNGGPASGVHLRQINGTGSPLARIAIDTA